MSARTSPAKRDDRPQEDHFVKLYPVRWADYQRLLAIRGERSAPRITYLEGLVEIMSPSRSHESIKSMTGCLVEVYCLENDIEFSTYGSWTIEDEEAERGAEPDECYVFGHVADPRRPDLAIEVEWTAGRIDKLAVYRGLGVREVWYWRRGRFQPYVLRRGRCVAVSRSRCLPELDLDQLVGFLDRPTTSQAIREYRASLRKKK